MKNSNDTIPNRTHDLPACSTAPQPTVPPHAPRLGVVLHNYHDYPNMIPLHSLQFSWKHLYSTRLKFSSSAGKHTHTHTHTHSKLYQCGCFLMSHIWYSHIPILLFQQIPSKGQKRRIHAYQPLEQEGATHTSLPHHTRTYRTRYHFLSCANYEAKI